MLTKSPSGRETMKSPSGTDTNGSPSGRDPKANLKTADIEDTRTQTLTKGEKRG